MRLYELSPNYNTISLMNKSSINESHYEMFRIIDEELLPVLSSLNEDDGTISKIKSILTKVKDKAQNSAPIKMADQKADEFIQKIKAKLGDNHKAVKYAQQIGNFAKEHPKWTNFGIGALAGAVSVLGTPAAGMMVAGLLRTSAGMMKGEKLSTAAGKAIGMAAISVIGGEVAKDVIHGLTNVIAAGISPDIVMHGKDLAAGISEYRGTLTLDGKTFSYDMLATPEKMAKLEALNPANLGLDINDSSYDRAWIKYVKALNDYQNDATIQANLYIRLDAVKDQFKITHLVKKIGDVLGPIIGGGAAAVAADPSQPDNTDRAKKIFSAYKHDIDSANVDMNIKNTLKWLKGHASISNDKMLASAFKTSGVNMKSDTELNQQQLIKIFKTLLDLVAKQKEQKHEMA